MDARVNEFKNNPYADHSISTCVAVADQIHKFEMAFLALENLRFNASKILHCDGGVPAAQLCIAGILDIVERAK